MSWIPFPSPSGIESLHCMGLKHKSNKIINENETKEVKLVTEEMFIHFACSHNYIFLIIHVLHV